MRAYSRWVGGCVCDLGAGEGRHKDADRAHAKRSKVEAKRESNNANLACFLGTRM